MNTAQTQTNTGKGPFSQHREDRTASIFGDSRRRDAVQTAAAMAAAAINQVLPEREQK